MCVCEGGIEMGGEEERRGGSLPKYIPPFRAFEIKIHTLSAASSKRFMFISLIAENERVGVALRIDFVNMDSIFQK